MKLGISPINWTNDDEPALGGEITLEQCLHEMQKAGYKACEHGNKFPMEPSTLLPILEQRELSLASKWFCAYAIDQSKSKDNINDFEKHLCFLSGMGSKVVVVCECSYSVHSIDQQPLAKRPVWTKEQLNKISEHLNELGEIANSYNIKLVYHQHLGTGIQTEQELCWLMENTHAEKVGLLVDTGHMHFAGINTLKIIDLYSNRIKHVHLKDTRERVLVAVNDSLTTTSFLGAVKQGVFTVPGDGCINFKIILSKLQSYDYSGWYIVEAEQDPAKANPYDYAKKAYEYLMPILN